MNERPILFSGPMVRAILENRKTQTRRVVKLRDPSQTYSVHGDDGWPSSADECGMWHKDRCPYGAPGDRLWVREAWCPQIVNGSPHHLFKASWPQVDEHGITTPVPTFKWKPSIHMPRWASRITLEITEVRVERLHELSDGDAINEGILSVRSPEWDRQHFPAWRSEFDAACAANRKPPVGPMPTRAFKALWESINGKGSWGKNPWVWVIGFERVDGEKS